MSKRHFAFALLPLAILATGLILKDAFAQPDPGGVVAGEPGVAAPAPAGGFVAKFCVVEADPRPDYPNVLADPHVAAIGDRYFLVGKSINGGVPWVTGATVWIPTNQIRRICEYESLEAIKKLIRL